MHANDYWLIAAFFILVLAPAPWLGRYLYRAMEGERTWLTPVFQPVERLCYRIAGIDQEREQNWMSYCLALLGLTAFSLLGLLSMLMLQGQLPLNPQQLPGLEWHLALNTAVSFVTNTNWQAYSGEAQLSYFSQMLGLGVQNFVSPAVGLAVLVVLCRALSRRNAGEVGNFWVDMTRAVLYGLLPFSLILALLLVWQGVPQSLAEYVQVVTLQGSEQSIPLGPAASQIAIKQLGTNGGGFFGVNSAHPFENPTAWSNLLEVASILLLPAALVFMFGHYVRDLRQTRAILACMLVLFSLGLGTTLLAEHQPNPAFVGIAVEQTGPLEGKESRLGIAASALWATVTSAASNGSVNAMHDSFSPPWRHGADVQHDAGRDRVRRCWRRLVRHVAVRAGHGFPGGTDDRPHTRVPGQEARSARGLPAGGVSASDAGGCAGAGCARCELAGARCVDHQSWPSWAEPDPVCVHVGYRQ